MNGGAASAAWNTSALEDLARMADRLGCRIRHDEPLSRHTSMGVGGPCPAMVWPRRPAHVRAVADWTARRGLSWRLLGGGTNLLVSDAGVPEPVVNTTELVEGESYDSDGVRLPAGVPTASALRRTVRRGFDGLVWAAGLPGTIGGAAAGNAGCWGGDMAGSVGALDVVDGHGHAHRLRPHELEWSYRSLVLPAALPAPVTILAVEAKLEPGDPAALETRYVDLQERKRTGQPVGARNSGCIFRNPYADRTAGQLIDAAGCKGLRVGDVEVSEVHANFFVNRGAARAADVDALVQAVTERVRERFAIELRPEIRRW